MVKLLRGFREKMVMRKQVLRYLAYALGEIVLVVLGILFALQINNWNESRKLAMEEQALLSDLKVEFEENLIAVQNDYNQNLKGLKDSLIPNEHNDRLLAQMQSWSSLNLKLGITEQTLSSGKLSILQNERLRYLLSQWPGIITNIEEDNKIRLEHIMQELGIELGRFYPMKNMDRYVDLGFWTKDYDRERLPASKLSGKLEATNKLNLESLMYSHINNTDYVLLNDVEIKDLIQNILNHIEKSIDDKIL